MEWMPGIILLIWHGALFFFLGRWSVIRGPRYRMGDQVVEDITQILDKRPMIGDNGITITTTRKWKAFGYDWILSVGQDSDRKESGSQSSALPQG